MTKRPKQLNCQHEPPYPDHETVVFSIRFPDEYLGEDDSGEVVIKKFEEMSDKTKASKKAEPLRITIELENPDEVLTIKNFGFAVYQVSNFLQREKPKREDFPLVIKKFTLGGVEHIARISKNGLFYRVYIRKAILQDE